MKVIGNKRDRDKEREKEEDKEERAKELLFADSSDDFLGWTRLKSGAWNLCFTCDFRVSNT